MDNNQIQRDILIIKKMIEKTRGEAAESGHFFMGIGILSIIGTITIGLLESFQLYHFMLPVLISMLVINGLIGYITVEKQGRKEKVTSYSKTVCYNVLLACAVPMIMVVFLFPLLKVYPWTLVPVLVSLIMGIMIFSTGVIFEVPSIKWCGMAWWIGAFFMTILEGSQWPQVSLMCACIAIGFILPGYILNKQYRKRSHENGS